MRTEFSKKTKQEALRRAEFGCEHVGKGGERCERNWLNYDKLHYDHVIPDALGGSNQIDNCAVLCEAHHREKTSHSDVPRISKAKRQSKYHSTGRSRARKGPPIPGSKDTKWKRKMNGKTVRR